MRPRQIQSLCCCRTPTGLAPEIAFFRTEEATRNFPSVQDTAGGGDFVVKPNVSASPPGWPNNTTAMLAPLLIVS